LGQTKMRLQIVLILLVPSAILARPENSINEVKEDDGHDNQKCPPWGKWQASKCLWPSQPFTSVPKACTSLPTKPQIPDVLKQFVQSKEIEVYSFVQQLFNLRGANAACGYCSRKIRCRQRQNGEWKKGCGFIQAQIVNEQCAGTQACEITPILGACPPPVPLPARRRPRELDLSGNIENIASHFEGFDALNVEAAQNASLGPPLWHCVRNKNGSKCLCCCGWYFPDAKSGKCVSLKKEDQDGIDIDQNEGDASWAWNGLINPQGPIEAQLGLDDGTDEQTEMPQPSELVQTPPGNRGQVGDAEVKKTVHDANDI